MNRWLPLFTFILIAVSAEGFAAFSWVTTPPSGNVDRASAWDAGALSADATPPFASAGVSIEPTDSESAIGLEQFETCPTPRVHSPCQLLKVQGGAEVLLPDGWLGGAFTVHSTQTRDFRWEFRDANDDVVATATSSRTRRDDAFQVVLPPGEDLRIRLRSEEPASFYLIAVDRLESKQLSQVSLGGEFSSAALATGKLRQVAADPQNAERVYAIQEDGHLLRSSDQGRSWTVMNVPWSNTLDFAIAPLDAHQLFVVAEDGAYYSSNRGETWLAKLPGPFATGRVRPGRERGYIQFSADQMLFESSDFGASISEAGAFDEAVADLALVSRARQSTLRLSNGLVMRREAGGTWEPDPQWSNAQPIQSLLGISGCGLMGIRNGQLWTAGDTETPALPISTPDEHVLSVSQLAHDRCNFLVPTGKRLLQLNSDLNFASETSIEAGSNSFSNHRAFRGPNGVLYGLLGGQAFRYTPQPKRPCRETQCFHSVRVDRPGFYVAQLALPQSGTEGVFSALVNSKPIGALVVGAVLPAGGEQPGFASIVLERRELLHLKLREYTGNIDTLIVEVKRAFGSERTTVFGPIESPPFVEFETQALERGRYVVSVRSKAGDPKGRFGISIGAKSIARGTSFGGWMDDSEERPFVALQTNFSLSVEVRYGDYFASGLGVSQPEFSVSYQIPGGNRLPYFPPKPLAPNAFGNIERATGGTGNQRLVLSSKLALSGDGSRFISIGRLYGATIVERWSASGFRLRHQGFWDVIEGFSPTLHRRSLTTDGQVLVYTNRRPNGDQPDVIVLGPGGRTFLNTPERHVDSTASITPDGSQIWVTAPDANVIQVLDRATGIWDEIELDRPYQPGAVTAAGDFEFRTEEENGELRLIRLNRQMGTSDMQILEPPLRIPGNAVRVGALSVAHVDGPLIATIVETRPGSNRTLFSRIFSYDVGERQWALISRDNSGNELEQVCDSPTMTADGRHVLFTAALSNSPTGELRNSMNVLRKNIQTGKLETIAFAHNRVYQLNASADGQTVVFTSEASNLTPYDTNGDDVFVWRAR